MLMLGASTDEARGLAEAVMSALEGSAPCLLFCDGCDVIALIGEPGDAPGELQRQAVELIASPS